MFRRNGSEDQTRIALASRVLEVEGNPYTGTNVYGARASVTVKYKADYEIAMSSSVAFVPTKHGLVQNDFLVKLTMEPQGAQDLKEKLGVLAVCRLLEPYATSSLLTATPTLDNPTQVVTQLRYIHTELQELWFYNISSGRVVGKVAPSVR